MFHVNADDPEAAAWTALLALAYRQQFGVMLLLILSVSSAGHERDEPAFTQPLMYQQIANHPRVLETYSQQLLGKEIITATELEEEKHIFKNKLTTAHQHVKKPAATTKAQPKNIKTHHT